MREGTHMNLELQLVILPVTDVDRAKAFYVDRLGFNADHDQQVNESLRFVQLTPPDSACSIAFGTGITDAEPGTVKGLQLVTDDIELVHTTLVDNGVTVEPIADLDWGRFIYFADPDGNTWAVQQLPQRPA